MKYILLAIISACAANIVLAQDIQVLPSDPAVKSGYLPNGTAYYIASNPYMKNMADFSVVQRTGVRTIPGVAPDVIRDVAQESLLLRHHDCAPSAISYFSSVGVLPGRNGFFEVSDNATTFRFRNVNLSQGKEVLDSTLWMLMGIVGNGMRDADARLSQWYVPSDQAVIIAGDVNHDKVLEKLRMLSYMTPPAVSLPRHEYVWAEQDSVVVKTSVDDLRNLAVATVSWRLQRTPREYMNTVQPVVYGRYMQELGFMAEDHVRQYLKHAGIPFAYVKAEYLDSVASLSDESFTVSVAVAPSYWAEAVASIASVMSSLDAGRVSLSDLRKAENRFFDQIEGKAGKYISNRSYTDRCIAAFMYNAPLASEKEKQAFHSSREIADEMDLNLFKSIASASVASDRNLILECSTPGSAIDRNEVWAVFTKAWNSPMPEFESERITPSFPGIQEKVKVRSSKKEYVSGGTIWTLSNGFKVIFRNMPADGKVYYSLSLNGGYGSIKELETGEGAYMSDYLDLCRIGGAKASVFKDFVRRQGVTMEMRVDLSKMSIQGRTSKDKMDVLLKSLLTVLNDSRIDRDGFGYYVEGEELYHESLKGSVQERISAIDGIICPGYRYTSVRKRCVLTEKFADRADRYMDIQSSKVDDGALILVGEIDESKLKEALVLYAGGFATSGSVFMRPVVNYQPVSGKLQYTYDGNEDVVDVVMSAPQAFTADNYYSSGLAIMILRKSIIREIAGQGVSLKIKHECLRYPQERLNVMISMSDAQADVTAKVKSVLDNMRALDITDEEFSSYRTLFKQQMAIKRESPEYWMKTIEMRYLDGKDFTTDCDAKIDAVTKEKVLEILSSLNEGLRVEYVINKK